MTGQGTIINLFDWRQFKRFKIREDRLPPGSTVRFKEFSILIAFLILCPITPFF
jgi:hypothetical protein